MLYANALGLEVVMPAYPLDGRGRRRKGGGLGAYSEGTCSEGKDFICGPVNGVHSCRPCNTAQLAMFKGLQAQINRIVRARGYNAKYLLDIDGRIGPLTATSLGVIAKSADGVEGMPGVCANAIAAAQKSPADPNTHRQIATVTPELAGWLGTVADKIGASQDVPTPPTTPSDGGNGPIPVPEPPITTGVIRPSAGAFLALLGGVVGVGLVGYGIQRYRERHG